MTENDHNGICTEEVPEKEPRDLEIESLVNDLIRQLYPQVNLGDKQIQVGGEIYFWDESKSESSTIESKRFHLLYLKKGRQAEYTLLELKEIENKARGIFRVSTYRVDPSTRSLEQISRSEFENDQVEQARGEAVRYCRVIRDSDDYFPPK